MMSGKELNEARGNDQERLGDDEEIVDSVADDTSEKVPLLSSEIQTLKITSPRKNRSKKCDPFQIPFKELNDSNEVNEPNDISKEQTRSDDTTGNDEIPTERQRSYTEPSRPLRWRLIGAYQDLRISRCRRIYARSGRKDDLALFFHNGRFYALEAWCSHMGGPLFEGEIEDYNGRCHVMCPWHSYMFDLATGKNEIGLQQNVPDLKYEDGQIYVRYHTEVSVLPCRSPSDASMTPPPTLNSQRKISNPGPTGRARKESILENVMKLSPVEDIKTPTPTK